MFGYIVIMAEIIQMSKMNKNESFKWAQISFRYTMHMVYPTTRVYDE